MSSVTVRTLKVQLMTISLVSVGLAEVYWYVVLYDIFNGDGVMSWIICHKRQECRHTELDWVAWKRRRGQ